MVREYSRHLGQYEKLYGSPAHPDRHGISLWISKGKTVSNAGELRATDKGITKNKKAAKLIARRLLKDDQ